jgi:GNAT superfamily N-acetyltransferase
MKARPARPARLADAGEIVRLASVMFESMGLALERPDWPACGHRAVRERLGKDMMAFVIDDPDEAERLVASAAGTIHRRLPRPGDVEFTAGYVQWVATEEEHRRKGLGQAVMDGLLGWFCDNGATAVELHATPMAEPLYRTMGFTDRGPRALRIRDLSEWRRARANL